ncbi:hypothetical protein KVA01_15890 [Kocuria varians]|uniref:DUF6318 domain-containing protein n=2 Tax=Kocuria varians TaxID=1272 RepID=A0A4Y4D6U6_KOCVA|nr:hypothetical protein KVA01_15890 [Kocuria varians]
MGTHRSGSMQRTASGVALAFLAAALVTGCSGGDGSAESASDGGSPSASASASPSETASVQPTASGGSTATPSGSESPLPDDWRPQEPTVLATGQKVPDDYEPATLEHPARNVPKPVMPEEAKNETEAGAQAFLNYRADAQWYSIQTGDTSLVREVTSTDCEKCTEQFNDFDSIYSSGNWAGGGFEKETLIPNAFTKRQDGGYNLPVKINSLGMIKVTDNHITLRQEPFNLPNRFDTYLYYENGSWMYLTASPRGSL